jgi:cyclophilin family peptidyl-prolyl cis-trans isomerase
MKKTFLFIALLFVAGISTAQKKSKPETDGPKSIAGPIVEITTSYGVIKIQLSNETPLHRDNFLKLAKEGFYDGTLFHRVMANFMIQGGDPDSKTAAPGVMLGNGDVGYTIPAEFRDNLYHKKGALAAARRENPAMESSGCQFYIVQGKKYTDEELTMIETRTNTKFTPEQRQTYITIGGTPFLDKKYTVYGQVISGLEVVDAIAAVKTGTADRPVTDVKMTVKVIN